MSTYQVLDGTGNIKYVYGLSTGTSGDPYRLVSKRYSNAIVEDGKVFTVSVRSTLANSGVYNYLLKTPATPKVTIYQIDVVADGAPFFHDLYEGASVSANGTAIVPFNNNRTSATTASSLFYSAPTVTANGVQFMGDLIPGGKTAGAQDTGEFRITLLPSTNYLLVITNAAGQTNNFALLLKFSET